MYPTADKTSTVSSVCLKFYVVKSSAVQLLVAVITDISEDNFENTTSELPSDNSANYRQQIGEGRHSITVLPGRQYVEFTAMNAKVITTSDRVVIQYINLDDGPCESHAERK